MSGVLLRMGVIAAVAVSLAGCGNDPAKNGLTATVGHSVGAALTSTRGPAQPVVVTRAMIRALKVPILMFGLPSRKARLAMATDGHNGDVVTWRAADGSTVSLRSGVVVATRGAGSDLMSAAVPSLAQLESGSGTVERRYYYLNGLDQSVALTFTCQLQDLGAESIDVVELRYTVHHVAETCSGDAPTFTNDYWIGPNHVMRKSKQWLGKTLGYAVIENLTE